MPDQGAFAERTHHDHADAELGGQRQQFALTLTLARVERDLQHLEASRPQRARELAEGTRRVVRYTEQIDSTFAALALEPREVLLP